MVRVMNSCQRVLKPWWWGLAALAWCCALFVVWNRSTLGGGDVHRESVAAARQVAKAGALSSYCRELAESLVEARARAIITARRPTAGMFAARLETESGRWMASDCPDAALPGIAFGASETARTALGRS